jgi:hypothetical protein
MEEGVPVAEPAVEYEAEAESSPYADTQPLEEDAAGVETMDEAQEELEPTVGTMDEAEETPEPAVGTMDEAREAPEPAVEKASAPPSDGETGPEDDVEAPETEIF